MVKSWVFILQKVKQMLQTSCVQCLINQDKQTFLTAGHLGIHQGTDPVCDNKALPDSKEFYCTYLLVSYSSSHQRSQLTITDCPSGIGTRLEKSPTQGHIKLSTRCYPPV